MCWWPLEGHLPEGARPCDPGALLLHSRLPPASPRPQPPLLTCHSTGPSTPPLPRGFGCGSASAGSPHSPPADGAQGGAGGTLSSSRAWTRSGPRPLLHEPGGVGSMLQGGQKREKGWTPDPSRDRLWEDPERFPTACVCLLHFQAAGKCKACFTHPVGTSRCSGQVEPRTNRAHAPQRCTPPVGHGARSVPRGGLEPVRKPHRVPHCAHSHGNANPQP